MVLMAAALLHCLTHVHTSRLAPSVFRRVGVLSFQESLPKKLDPPFRGGCLWPGQQLLRQGAKARGSRRARIDIQESFLLAYRLGKGRIVENKSQEIDILFQVLQDGEQLQPLYFIEVG